MVSVEKQLKLAKANNTQEKMYEQLVTKYIRSKYSQSRIEAIVNNYLDEPTNEKYLAEFQELQSYRKECKLRAKFELGI